jgi:hypothetical protein
MPSDGPPGSNRPRASRNVKLVLMGVAGVALLYSCTPAIGSAIGGFPGFWFLGNPFYRGPAAPACGPNVPGNPQCTTGTSSSSGSGSSVHSGGSSRGSSAAATSSQSSGSSASQSTSSRGGFGSSAAAHGPSGGSS